MANNSPQEGIVNAYLGKINKGDVLSKKEKIQFANCLEWVIDNEKDKKILAWAYNLRGNIHAGKLPQVCE